mgnify:CR=1 FL=1|jgi:OPA family glycerol-3-phosphate transporter-like MFS transporter
MAQSPADRDPGAKDPFIESHPPGFRLRRGRNWFFLGLTYASYYLCRYNLGIVAPELKSTLGFSNTQYGSIESARNGAYAVGQFINGLFTDKLGGKQAMTIGAVGTAILNLAFGWAAWSDISIMLTVLIMIRLADGYVQAFGAPGMVKINTAWFRRRERGTFAGIFGIMINLGQMGVGQLAPLLATGFSVPLLFYTIKVGAKDWRYMFIVPPVIVIIVVILMNLMVRNHPEEAGYRIVHDEETHDDDPHARVHLSDVFRKITGNPVVWIVAGAYFCTGFVRAAVYAWWVIYMLEVWGVGKQHGIFWWMAVVALPMMASAGSLCSGVISDKFFGGRRAPVAALLYLSQVFFILLAMAMSMGWFTVTAGIAALTILGIHTGCNATHSLLGTAAAMDLGGRKMAGFAAGVIDSFQYFGAMLAGAGLGWILDRFALNADHAADIADAATAGFNPTVWFATMLPWGLLGTILMTYLWLRHRGTDERGT